MRSRYDLGRSMPMRPLPFLLITCLLAAPITRAEDSPLRATELVVCREILDLECRGLDRTYGPEVESVTFFTRIEGATGEAFVFHVWSFEGKEVRRQKLPVRGSPYRTWSTKRVKGLPGKWQAEILDPLGRSLGAVDFVVQPPKERS